MLETRAAAAASSAATNAMLKRVAARTGAMTWDPVEVLCPNGPCIYQGRMLTYYKDTGHLTNGGSRLLLLPLIQAMAAQMR